MKFVVPIEVDESNLTTNVENEAPDWAAGSYDEGDQAVFGEFVYEALSTTTDQPDKGAIADPPTWVLLGRANKWRMWRDGVDSVSTRAGNIEVSVQLTDVPNTVAVLGMSGVTVQVTMADPVEGIVYDETRDLVDIGVGDWWEYYFTGYGSVTTVVFDDLPAYANTELTIVITAATSEAEAACGRVVIGPDIDAGRTLQGVTSRNMTFSKKERDAFGNLTLITRRTIRVIDYPIVLPSGQVDYVQQQAAALSATPTLFIGHPDHPEINVFGVIESCAPITTGLEYTECSITVEEF